MNLGPMEIGLILLIILLLFGATKLPNLARSVGRSARIFKSEMKEMNNENKPAAPQAQSEDFWDRPENQPRAIDNRPANPTTEVRYQPQQHNENPQAR
ncbi:Sec-independent protein translocase subunit TatA [Corynebacterium tapiri]|uniref:Sec-independent protein translocase protein TatA n=1 Tax=Corynebacterium tapiri TaxID=1448266 RepID=A0A5C4U3X7_9CORY|nr:Sec-independent protein translocase subunit TatA [Corynebacterium tapiri]TNL97616.1 twin-arginine translocase TatA/TatE family subunit [Corynebacterium tapiri]